MNKEFLIKSITDETRPFVDKKINDSWAGPYIVTKGVLHDTRTHSGFVAVCGNEVVGYILYHIINNECEITVLESLREKQGIGGSLIKAVGQAAKKAGCRRMWLITTNDNTQAIRFYQRFGFLLKAVHIGAIKASRKLKPQIPLIGCDNIPIMHEFEFEIPLVIPLDINANVESTAALIRRSFATVAEEFHCIKENHLLCRWDEAYSYAKGF